MIKNKKGFTLIELIIVMAIIGILAVVAIVAISGKSADARDARRQADMSAAQTGLALVCYSNPTAFSALGAPAALSTLGTLTDGGTPVKNVISFGGVNDPSGEAGLCTGTGAAPAAGGCNYTMDAGSIPCTYTIFAYLEVDNNHLTVTQAGMVETEI